MASLRKVNAARSAGFLLPDQRVVDKTELATLAGQFSLRLMQCGFRLMQVIDTAGHDVYHYILPPVCDVPAGPFTIGSDRQQQVITLGAYQIGRFPLTVAEYACAVRAAAVPEPATGDYEHVTWQQQLTYFGNEYPVVNITWFQSVAYAVWLANMTGERWRLPTEVEWEKAARGTDGRIYPWGNAWGNERANTVESGIGMTTPVDNYLEGASPYGAQDMAGNVWEWCSSLYHPYPYHADDGREDIKDASNNRVLRGSSWNDSLRLARVDARYWDTPNAALFSDYGARLVVERASS